ncbi:putative cobalamin synthesis protein [Hypoxylon sp. FL0890]|nr:putative cobalamin synthesis protein [Hypoxylon sp. FL0890]
MSPATLFKKTDDRLPVTLLSGFLGSGKTTLLENILTSADHGLRIGVIVNDVGALNIDAALLTSHDVTRKEEQVVAMQNGCICCTLRGDLLEEVARLAEEKQVEYLVIESSGVSEPMQVAETFSEEFADMHIAAGYDLEADEEGDKEMNKRLAEILKAGGLSKIARLDTCVTLVDAVNFMQDFATADFLVDRQTDVPQEDDRNISDLQVDQLEFADVVCINKCDLVSKEEVNRIKGVVKKLNPSAKVISTVKSRLDLTEIIDTRLFSYEKAALSAGWLKSLNEEINPETEEYGIGTFVYRARRPFHPARLWDMIKSVFVVIQTEYQVEGEDMDVNEDEVEGEDDEADEDSVMEDEQPQLDTRARLASKMIDPTFGPLLRSKGFLWLATRPKMYGEWSQAGVMLTISGQDLWRCEVPEDEWPTDPDTKKAITRDFDGKWGDRRQELVFIGQQMRNGGEYRLRRALDACLLNDEEFRDWEAAMESDAPQDMLDELFEDGFEDWIETSHESHDHANSNGHGHSHGGHEH